MTAGRRRPRDRLVRTAVAVRRVAAEAEVSFVAAALAYYAFVSAVPLVVLGLTAATAVGGDALADRLVGLVAGVLAPAGETLLRQALTSRAGVGGVTVVGLVVLLWGALKAVRAIDRGFSRVYGRRGSPSAVRSVVDALVALSGVGLAMSAVLVIGAVVAWLGGAAVGAVGNGLLLLTLVAAFLPLYYLLPDADLTLREAVPGAVGAAVGWTALGAAFQLYAAIAPGGSVYGLLGGVILALTWFYVGALVLLLGAVVNAVRSGHAAPSVDD